jgi:nitrogenase molybdenum-iron protein alpha/beta subunit
MKNISASEDFPKTYVLPYQLGVFLAVNAVPDVCLIIDGLNCVLPKAGLLAGNHDIHSTLFSPDGRHRVVCTMTGPLPQQENPEAKLRGILNDASARGEYGALLLTGLPYMGLAGMDYEGIVSDLGGRTPAAAIAPLSLEADWLDGYDRSLEALVSLLKPPRRARRKKGSIVIAGYMYDRNERDHLANAAELRRLTAAAGLDLAAIIPGGESFRNWERAFSAGLVVSLPYGRRAAARLASATGARLVETGLPVGFSGTTAWLRTVRKAAGLSGAMPRGIIAEERDAAGSVSRALAALEHARLMFAGDPHLFAAMSGFARELGMRSQAAIINSSSRPIPGPAGTEKLIMFSPSVGTAREMISGLAGYDAPSIALCDSLALGEGLAGAAKTVEIGFPSYTHHCLHDEPFMGYAGARVLAGRMLNALLS